MSNTANNSLIGKSIKLNSIKSSSGKDAIVFDENGKTFFNNITQSTPGGPTSVANGSGLHFFNPADGSKGKVGGGEITFDKSITTTIQIGQELENGIAVNFPLSIDAYSGYAYGNGVLLVAADDIASNYDFGRILKSTDMGLTWTPVFDTIGEGTWVYSPAYGNGVFVASIWDGRFVYSLDMGDTWTYTPGPVGGQQSFWSGGIIYAQNKFVSTGAGGKIQTSTDGINWTLAATTAAGVNLGSPIYQEGLFVVGEDYFNGAGRIHYSNNATNWTTVTLSSVANSGGSFTNGGYRFFAYGNGKFVSMAAFNQYFVVSDDGINWTQYLAPIYGFLDYTLFFNNGKFYVQYNQSNPQFYESTDGITWTLSSSTFSPNTAVRTNTTDAFFFPPPKIYNGHLISSIFDYEFDDSYHYIVYPPYSYDTISYANTVISPDNINIKTIDSSNSVYILNINSESLKIESNNSIFFSNVDFTSIGNSTVNTQISIIPNIELKLNSNGTFFSVNSSLVQYTGNNFTLGSFTAGTNGYTYLNNGMLLQWGWFNYLTGSSSSYTNFTTAFPNKCLFAHVSPGVMGVTTYPQSIDGSLVTLNLVQSTNTTAITIRTLNGTEPSQAYYFAIGF